MIYGRGPRGFIESGPVEQAARAGSLQSVRSWQALSKACRLALVEQAIRAANDGYPLAL